MTSMVENLFESASLSEIDSLNNAKESKLYRQFIKLYPNLTDIFNLGQEKDKLEFDRLIKHVFRMIKIFQLLKENTFIYQTLSKKSLSLIYKKLNSLNSREASLLILILIYHDIGKLIRKRDHPYQSYKLILDNLLLSPFKLNKNDEMLVKKIIQYHLIFATIYTGESTFYSVYSLINDKDFCTLISNQDYLMQFVDFLEIFTFIDILGYSYAEIYDHYIKYYSEISSNLKSILEKMPDKTLTLSIANQFSQKWIEWRIAGALRIFQFVETKPYLTKDFYYEKLRSTFNDLPEKYHHQRTWNDLIKNALSITCRVQIKYALAFLVILAFGSFQRARVNKDAGISYKLIQFWIILSEKISLLSIAHPYSLWNVYIIGIKNWFGLPPEILQKLNENAITESINDSVSYFDEESKEYTLEIDLGKQLLVTY
jgi:hypothetical protein